MNLESYTLNELARYLMHNTDDMRAFSLLYEKTKPAMTRFVQALVEDNETVKDIVQDTFVKILSRYHQYDGRHFKTWAYAIARNEAREFYRQSKRFSSSSELDLERMTFEDGAFRAEVLDREKIHQAINEVPEKWRTETTYFLVEHMSPGEIALATNASSLSAVKSRIFRGREHVQKILRTISYA